MQIRINLELHGEPEEIGLLLAQLGDIMIGDEYDDDADPDDLQDDGWSREQAENFVRELTDPALHALSVIAANAPRVGFRELQRRMGVAGPQLAGRLSSIGYTVARQGTPFPFVRDHYQKVYVMEEDVAEVMREATAAETARRRQQASRGSVRPSSDG